MVGAINGAFLELRPVLNNYQGGVRVCASLSGCHCHRTRDQSESEAGVDSLPLAAVMMRSEAYMPIRDA